jgi:succinate dehydrogenase/fumarate reductase flavoprotein subunit
MATSENAAAADSSADVDITVDVLVIGGGASGVWAALAAIEDGSTVAVAEKGYLGTSGPFGIGANTGIYYIMPEDQQQRDAIVMARQPIAFGLSDPAWGYKVFDQSYANLDAMAKWGFKWPRNSEGKEHRGSLRGPTILHFLREVLVQKGAIILDHSPALELLIHEGVAAGARGVNKQTGGAWQVRAGSVVVTTGGTTFLSGVAGDKTHTGDGYLLAAEAGAEFSGMEFSSQYHAAPSGSNLTRGAFRSGVGTYYDNNGEPTQEGRKMVQSIMETGGAWDQLDKTKDPVTQDLIRKTHAACFQFFERKGIDPFNERYPVSFLLEGTMRAAGGIAIDDDLQTTVPGLFAGGDVTSREKLVGAGPPGGGPAAAWAFSTGSFAGHSAASFARKFARDISSRKVTAVGGAGLRPTKGPNADLTAADVIKTVRDEMLPFEKNYWRSGPVMQQSLTTFNTLWKDVSEGLAPAQHNDSRAQARATLKSREAASLLAAGRWIYAAANERTETRGLHRRTDFPELDAKQDGQHIITGGVDDVWVKRRAHVPTLSLSQRLAS